ncbi:MAG TPA: SprT-like domain-containing protein [Vicinamibacterales bacterium]|nr:SprT-like domain-containing protein [Vicinamibacterales bacterium]
MTKVVLIAAGAVALTGAAWSMSPGWSEKSQSKKQAASTTSADERQRQLLKEAIDTPPEPALMARFASINGKHFANALTAIPVTWEPRLADVGAAAGRSFKLLGMFGQAGDKSIILLHPSLKDDAAALDRALCHEMVHAYLFSIGDTGTDHGEAFKKVLHRLSNEGAFVSIEATPEERAQLREWLATEETRLAEERASLDHLQAELDPERIALQQAVDELNARTAAANATGRGFPSSEEAAATNARRNAYNDRAATMNRRGLEFRIAQEEYNRQVARYNLMATYPDGLDDPAPVRKRD